MFRYLTLFVIIGIGSAGVLLTNGDFEQELSVGWLQFAQYQGASDSIDRATSFDPDPDYEVRVKKYCAGNMKLYQCTEIPTTDLEFSVYAKLYADVSSSSYWSAAAIILAYINNSNTVLGETRICYKTSSCPWSNSPTLHLIVVTDPNNWYNYSFNIADELTNLPGVNPSDIARIEVSLYSVSNAC